jgi:hypothetical protein
MAELVGVRGAGCTGYRGSRAAGERGAGGAVAVARRCLADRSVARVGELRAMAVEFPVVQIQTELLRAGVLTVDEVREMRGLPKMAAAGTEVAG